MKLSRSNYGWLFSTRYERYQRIEGLESNNRNTPQNFDHGVEESNVHMSEDKLEHDLICAVVFQRQRIYSDCNMESLSTQTQQHIETILSDLEQEQKRRIESLRKMWARAKTQQIEAFDAVMGKFPNYVKLMKVAEFNAIFQRDLIGMVRGTQVQALDCNFDTTRVSGPFCVARDSALDIVRNLEV